VTALRGDVQRRVAADARDRRRIRTRCEQRRGQLLIAVLGRLVQRRHPVALSERRGAQRERDHRGDGENCDAAVVRHFELR